jgi:hypothetical protein
MTVTSGASAAQVRAVEGRVCRIPKLTVHQFAQSSGHEESRCRAAEHDHVQYLPEQCFAMTLAQAVTPGVCETAATVFPGSNPGPVTRNPRSGVVPRI